MNASRKPGNTIVQESRTVGLDLGDKFSHYCVLAESGDLVEEGRIKLCGTNVSRPRSPSWRFRFRRYRGHLPPTPNSPATPS